MKNVSKRNRVVLFGTILCLIIGMLAGCGQKWTCDECGKDFSGTAYYADKLTDTLCAECAWTYWYPLPIENYKKTGAATNESKETTTQKAGMTKPLVETSTRTIIMDYYALKDFYDLDSIDYTECVSFSADGTFKWSTNNTVIIEGTYAFADYDTAIMVCNSSRGTVYSFKLSHDETQVSLISGTYRVFACRNQKTTVSNSNSTAESNILSGTYCEVDDDNSILPIGEGESFQFIDDITVLYYYYDDAPVEGSYTLSGDILTMSIDGETEVLKVVGNEITITNPYDHNVFKWRKID